MTDIIVKIIEYVGSLVLFLTPESLFFADVFMHFNSYLNTFIDFLATINFLVPLPDIFLLFSYMVSITVIKFSLFLSNWIVKRVFDVIP